MAGYNYNSIVSRHEAEALKEMIFKRARERAEALTNDVQEEYTSSAQNDIMEIARNSFTASKNPFSVNNIKAEPSVAQKTPEKTEPEHVGEEQKHEIGFPPRKSELSKHGQSPYQIANNDNDIVQHTIESNMDEARTALSKKQSFMGALNFLNAQASVALIKSRGQSFEAIA